MTKKLKYYGGSGFSCIRENGVFEVLSADGINLYKKFSEAKKYYDSLKEEKAIWDITKVPELLDSYIYMMVDDE